MSQVDLTFHHLGLAVHQPEKALAFLRGLGYQCGHVVRDERQNVHLIMCTHPDAPDVEIVFPTETPGPLAGILKDGREMIYHTCYQTSNLAAALQQLEAEVGRALCVSPAKPANLFQNEPVSFYYLEGVGLVEILESP